MIKIINSFKNKIKPVNVEEVYVFISSIGEESENIMKYIEMKMKNGIKDADYYTDLSTGETLYILASSSFNDFHVPLLYQLYAYIKLKDETKFSYQYETINYNNKKILKFTIECLPMK